ncbi:MAG: PDDEXK nuclease domain-containing protein [Candidatus Manganitrophus sp. SA1]|nr:PDDEXK nuclease domain-containing protein [Candidatus Manganitrophus morganii]
MNKTLLLGPEYLHFLAEMKRRITDARLSAARAVNRELILLYWDLGRAIVEKQERMGWGQAVIERLATDLGRAFPGTRGFSARNLRNMKQFYQAYSSPSIWQQAVAKLSAPSPESKSRQQLVAELDERQGVELMQKTVAEIPWGHHLLILNKIEKPAVRFYYLHATARFGWSRNVLLNQIKAGAYERSLKEGKAHNFPAALPEQLAEQAEEALKSSYNLEFLGIGRVVKERELEDRLIDRLRDFILELGYGFCFVGRQHRLTLGKKEYFIDLLFYHRFLKALVAVELKVGPFEPEYAGKMDFYLNLLNEKERAPDDRPSIGIILCAEKDNLEVEFALKTKTNPIGVAEYQLQPRLPAEFKGKLPSPKQLSNALRGELPD